MEYALKTNPFWDITLFSPLKVNRLLEHIFKVK
jgi:hypothetical protein